jgi:hypothetical protein
VRKYLGVLAGVVALMCDVVGAGSNSNSHSRSSSGAGTNPRANSDSHSHLQPPSQGGAPVSALELFGGGTYAEAGFFNAGHWAGLPGWDASLGGT